MTFNAGLNMAGSYYVATAHPAPDYPSLTGEIEADLVVVGGGCKGLSAALHAAERGLSVVVLEGGKVGWGASGRNGGQIIPGLRKGAVELVRAFGRERARALFDLSLEARELVLGLIARHAIACDLEATGHLLAAVKPSDLRHMEAEAECLATVMNYADIDLLSAAEARDEVAAPYAGGLMDRGGGHLHPLNYTLGLARAASAAGVTIFENAVATGLQQGAGARVTTAAGAVRARYALLAGDALLHGLAPDVNNRIMPVANYVVATEPLAEPRALIPRDAAISDSRFVVNYYRLTADGRLLFGGGERYTPAPPRDIAAFVRPYVEGVFPQLRGTRIDHAWGGLVSITQTRLPHIGRQGEVYFAHGYSGMGVILSTLAGKLVVEAMAGETDRFDLFAGVAPPPFPGGVALRGPLHVLGMLWYALRDRL
ncbi:MAG: NAD(P)/FAD-dependent oxidoreductase [Caulobacteraceae bacterium]